MRVFGGSVGLALLSVLLGCGNGQSSQSNFNRKAQIFAPDPGTQGSVEQALGVYYNGHLMNAMDIGFSGQGYIKLFTYRSTGWATFDMLALIRKTAYALLANYPNQEPLQIGDITAQHGGQLLRHASHQNGLDADIRLLAVNHHTQAQDTPGGFDEEYVANGRVSTNFDFPRNWLIIKTFAETGRLSRIFLDSHLKKAMCKYAKSIGEFNDYQDIFALIQHEDDHRDHMHIRITCPNNSPRCLPIKPAIDDGLCS